jgi:hypothetical protein
MLRLGRLERMVALLPTILIVFEVAFEGEWQGEEDAVSESGLLQDIEEEDFTPQRTARGCEDVSVAMTNCQESLLSPTKVDEVMKSLSKEEPEEVKDKEVALVGEGYGHHTKFETEVAAVLNEIPLPLSRATSYVDFVEEYKHAGSVFVGAIVDLSKLNAQDIGQAPAVKVGAGGVNVFDCDHTGVHRLATYGISTIRKQLQDVDVGGKMPHRIKYAYGGPLIELHGLFLNPPTPTAGSSSAFGNKLRKVEKCFPGWTRLHRLRPSWGGSIGMSLNRPHGDSVHVAGLSAREEVTDMLSRPTFPVM